MNTFISEESDNAGSVLLKEFMFRVSGNSLSILVERLMFREMVTLLSRYLVMLKEKIYLRFLIFLNPSRTNEENDNTNLLS